MLVATDGSYRRDADNSFKHTYVSVVIAASQFAGNMKRIAVQDRGA
jgi:hypothetical protein